MPGQGVPSVAAAWHSTTVAFGPESVKSAKKLSGRSGKTVSPTFTVSDVTIGNGIVMLFFGCSPLMTARASSSEITDRNGGCPIDMPLTFGVETPAMYLRKPFSASPPTTGIGRLASMNALMTPSVPPETQTPSTFGRLGNWPAVCRCAVAESHIPL